MNEVTHNLTCEVFVKEYVSPSYKVGAVSPCMLTHVDVQAIYGQKNGPWSTVTYFDVYNFPLMYGSMWWVMKPLS